jgi:hypothetical protein
VESGTNFGTKFSGPSDQLVERRSLAKGNCTRPLESNSAVLRRDWMAT